MRPQLPWLVIANDGEGLFVIVAQHHTAVEARDDALAVAKSCNQPVHVAQLHGTYEPGEPPVIWKPV